MAGYLIFHNRVTDPQKMAEYVGKAVPTLEKYGAELLVLDENVEVIEGELPLPRTVVVRFESRETAMAWYNSPEYQEVLPMRLEATEGYAVACAGFVRPGG